MKGTSINSTIFFNIKEKKNKQDLIDDSDSFNISKFTHILN